MGIFQAAVHWCRLNASTGAATSAQPAPVAPCPPLENSIATDETTMNGSNEDVNISSSRRVSAVAAATRATKRNKAHKTFDERMKDLMSFKAEFGHCNVPNTRSRNIKYYSLGIWCNNMRMSYKSIKEGRSPSHKLSKANIKRLENAGFQWSSISKTCTFDKRFKDLMAFKAEFDHCNVPVTKSSKHFSLGKWCSHIRLTYRAIQEGRGNLHCKISNADIKRLEKAGFEWRLK
jgi:hypothetical protein